jgi:hypothetical protein
MADSEKDDKRRCARRRRNRAHRTEALAAADHDADFGAVARDGGYVFAKDGKTYNPDGNHRK